MSQQHQKIQRYIIKSTPFGQLPEVIKDLQKLSPLDLTSPVISSTLQQYNEEHLTLLHLKNHSTQQANYFPIMPQSKVHQNQYLNQANKIIYTVDHQKTQIISVQQTSVNLDETVFQLLTNLNVAANKYVKKYYREPCGAGVFMNQTEDGLIITIGITCKNVQLPNYYTGQWISKWVIQKGSIQGNILIKAHFFQNGNVQFNQKKQVKKQFQFQQSMVENAKAIIKIIQQSQSDIQTALSDLYQEIPEKLFKNLRRITPYTRTKMSWNINAVKMNRNLLGVSK